MRLLLILAIALVSVGHAEESGDRGVQFYQEFIRPILQQNCLMCHSTQIKQGGLDLSSRAALLEGGENGAVVTPGSPSSSLLYKLVTHEIEPGMPFKGKKLPAESLARIKQWIETGVSYDEPVQSGKSPDPEPERVADAKAKTDHWAFRAPKRAPVPRVKHQDRVRNPIDAFLLAAMEERKLDPLPEADRRTQLRRVFLDLTGLPPSPEAIQSFLADTSKQAYERVVDQLLATPQYGERWGRHWMDVWRYSDWFGNRKIDDLRSSQRHIWRWRDWIVESLNEDKGYDRMILEMLAGDELAPDDPEVLAATGYLARNYFRYNRDTWMQDAVEYTSTAFLGLTMKCARCHSHKYDPIPQVDYYKFRAFFEPYDVRIDRVPGQPDTMKNGLARVFDRDASAPTYLYFRGNEQNPDKDHPLTPAIPSLFGKYDLKIEAVPLPIEAYYPDSRKFVHHDLIAAAQADIAAAQTELRKVSESSEASSVQADASGAGDQNARGEKIGLATMKLRAAEAYLPALQARIQAEEAAAGGVTNESLAATATKLERIAGTLRAQERLMRAQMELRTAPESDEKEARKRNAAAKKEVQLALEDLAKAAETYTPLGKQYAKSSTGRRLALARWIASAENPLTARVAVNHMWMRHFGSPLVPVMWNFGTSGKTPTHPELLDWLATEFMARGWSTKAMHRLMVTSSAYRRASWSAAASQNRSKDPDNTYLWRANVRRMEAEVVRDSVLKISGMLDSTVGGPDLEESSAENSYRRSLYYRHAAGYQAQFLKTFDGADPVECFRRYTSVVPQQALALANGRISLLASREVGRQLSTPEKLEPQFVKSAFERILGRQPSAEEMSECLRFLGDQQNLYRGPAGLHMVSSKATGAGEPPSDPVLRARDSLLLVLINHNDFVTIR